jgi:esterase/lipase superfamily enzyme
MQCGRRSQRERRTRDKACGGDGGARAPCRLRAAVAPVGEAARVPGASSVSMLVATTRAPHLASPSEMFSGERADELSFARIEIARRRA